MVFRETGGGYSKVIKVRVRKNGGITGWVEIRWQASNMYRHLRRMINIQIMRLQNAILLNACYTLSM